jgi:hypothetical protein
VVDGPDESESPDQVIADPESQVNHRRIKTIFDIRDSMTEARQKVKLASHNRNIARYEALSAYRALVDSYVVETEPMLRRYDPGTELLENQDFGAVTVNVETKQPLKGRDTYNSTVEVDVRSDPSIDKDWVTVSEVPKPVKYDVTGLLSVINLPDPLRPQFELNRSQTMLSSTNCIFSPTYQIDFEVLDRMVRSINNFLAEIGFEVDPQEEQETLEL